MQRQTLLQLALPLVRTHGFTREALARSVLALPKPHDQYLSDTAVSSLFGQGDDARRTLIMAWMEDARQQMRHSAAAPGASIQPTVRDVLSARLRMNEPVLKLLPEAFALVSSPASGLPPLDPTPGLKHVAAVADDACRISGDASIGLAWYSRRASVAAAYGAAELHQLTSPETAYSFLDDVLNLTQKAGASLDELQLFGNYVWRSWSGIVKSSGILR